jgi:SAM-dependent methyltransferase
LAPDDLSRCPACGADEAFAWRAAHEVRRGRPQAVDLPFARCRNCGTAWLETIPSHDEAELYESGPYDPGAGLVERLPSALGRLLDRDRLRLLGRLVPGSRVIDIGAGRGRLLDALQRAGHDAVGVDPFVPESESPDRPPIQRVGIEAASFEAGSADAVIFWHVLEHLSDPQAAIERAAAWLRPGGRVVVAVPNLASAQARIGGDRWFHQDVPRHRTQFTAGGVRALLQRCGIAVDRTRHLMLEQNVLGMWLTVLNHLTIDRDVPFRALKGDLEYDQRVDSVRDGALSVFPGIPLLPLAAVAELVAGVARRGGTVVVRGTRSQ